MLGIAGILGSLFSAAGNSFLSVLAAAINDACLALVKAMTTFWVNISTPSVATSPGSTSPSVAVEFLNSHLAWYIGAFCLLSVIVGVVRMIWEQRASAGFDLLKGLLIFIAVSALALTVISLLVSAADQFSTWIIGQSLNVPSSDTGAGTVKSMDAMLTLNPITGGSEKLFLVIFLGVIGACGALIQVCMMIVRSGMLILLAGVLPLTFSLWTTDLGRQWSKKASAWLLAFILYKPAAAIVYALAFQLLSEGNQAGSIDGVMTGIAMLFMAIIALPAMMRFIVPTTGAIAAGGAGMVLGAAGAAAGGAALARGAVPVNSMSGAAGTVGGGSSPSASGAAYTPMGGSSGASGAGIAAAVATGGAAAPVAAAISGATGAARGVASAAETSAGEGSQE
jgi:type IV secretion system protein TrbL